MFNRRKVGPLTALVALGTPEPAGPAAITTPPLPWKVGTRAAGFGSHIIDARGQVVFRVTAPEHVSEDQEKAALSLIIRAVNSMEVAR